LYVLHFHCPGWVVLQTRQQDLEGTGEVRLRDLVKESLRMRPSRIIFGGTCVYFAVTRFGRIR
jgi:pilus assembly protein CpaF